jgi:glycosyltransferase involved in cell wall biosynthesis
LPIISTDEGAISDIIDDGATGFIVEKKNPQILANKLKFLITNPKISKDMGEKGRVKFNKYYKIEIFEKRIASIISDFIKQ